MQNLRYYGLIGIFFYSISTYAQDYQILRTVNHSSFLTENTAEFITQTTYPLSVGLAFGYVGYGYFTKNKIFFSGISLSTSIIISAGVTFALKNIIERQRPFVLYNDIFLRTQENSLNESFPSGHTTIAFATATSLALEHKNIYITIPIFTYASLVGVSRLYQGVHYPSDVFFGAVIGIATSYTSFKVNQYLRKSNLFRNIINTQDGVE